MSRVQSKKQKKAKHKKILNRTKGFWGRRKNIYSVAKVASFKAMGYATRDRKTRKRDFRRLWIIRIKAACNSNGISYSKFINNLKSNQIRLNRKVLAEIAVTDNSAFSRLVQETGNTK
jgi:large subunit ribosomal protein L20